MKDEAEGRRAGGRSPGLGLLKIYSPHSKNSKRSTVEKTTASMEEIPDIG